MNYLTGSGNGLAESKVQQKKVKINEEIKKGLSD